MGWAEGFSCYGCMDAGVDKVGLIVRPPEGFLGLYEAEQCKN